MQPTRKPLFWLADKPKTPPFSKEARLEAGFLLGKLQDGELIGLPRSRPMPTIGRQCHELRITDANREWRVVYRTDADAILILEVFPKTTQATPPHVIAGCKQRLKSYDAAARGK